MYSNLLLWIWDPSLLVNTEGNFFVNIWWFWFWLQFSRRAISWWHMVFLEIGKSWGINTEQGLASWEHRLQRYCDTRGTEDQGLQNQQNRAIGENLQWTWPVNRKAMNKAIFSSFQKSFICQLLVLKSLSLSNLFSWVIKQ